jgi:hypothetical protein
MPSLPLQLIGEIALFCKWTFARRALANLNQTSRAVREITLPTLYGTVIWEDSSKEHWKEMNCPGWKYTK